MLDQLSRLNAEHLTFLAIMGAMVCAAATIVCGLIVLQVRRYRERQLELGFREEMLRRGHSVDEIVRVLTASRPRWSQSLMSLWERSMAKLSTTIPSAAARVPVALRNGRRWMVRTWDEVRPHCRKVWRRGQTLCRKLWEETRPLIRQGMKSLSKCVRWFGEGLDNLARRLAPNRP